MSHATLLFCSSTEMSKHSDSLKSHALVGPERSLGVLIHTHIDYSQGTQHFRDRCFPVETEGRSRTCRERVREGVWGFLSKGEQKVKAPLLRYPHHWMQPSLFPFYFTLSPPHQHPAAAHSARSLSTSFSRSFTVATSYRRCTLTCFYQWCKAPSSPFPPTPLVVKRKWAVEG